MQTNVDVLIMFLQQQLHTFSQFTLAMTHKVFPNPYPHPNPNFYRGKDTRFHINEDTRSSSP